MLTFGLLVQILLLSAVPIAIGLWFNRRWGLSWILFLSGALAFVSAWVISSIAQIGGVLGLVISAIAEMVALYLIYRYQLKMIRTEREALMVGTGLAGIELILMSIFALVSLLQMLPLRNASDETIINLAAQIKNVSMEEVEPADLDELRDLIDDYWSRPWYEPLLLTLQPLTFIPVQIALAVIALRAVTQNDLRPLFGAMAILFLTRVIPAYGALVGGFILATALSLLFGAIALWFLSRLWPVAKLQNEAALDQRRRATKQAADA